MQKIKQRIPLISKGIFYNEDSKLKSGYCDIYYPTAYHEEIISDTNLIKKNISEKIFIEELLVDKSINYNDLFLCDKNSILLTCRILSYGSVIDFKLICSHCDHENNISYNLLDLAEKFPFNYNQYGILFNVNEYTFNVSLPKIEYNSNLEFYKNHIISINDNSDKLYIQNFIENFPIKYSSTLSKCINNFLPNYQNKLTFNCEKCNNKLLIQMEFNKNIFPINKEYKKQIHDEIFLLSYHGQGGFQFNELYETPVYLRKYYFQKLIEIKKKEEEHIKKSSPKNSFSKFKK